MTALLSRRAFLGGGAAALAARVTASGTRPEVSLPAPEELDGPALLRRLGTGSGAKTERLGLSRAGRPIDLVSIGQGPRAALIVGAPHANEPIGCATVVRMLTRLSEDRALRERSGWQWHFIPAIDIDGVALNQGWFTGPRTLSRYLQDFYRPPFRLQPEYTFPLELPGYQFHEQTPESACWRLALDHIRPQLQCSLHGADTGGSFFLISQPRARLDAQLTRLPASADITLNTIGEPWGGVTDIAPGVFSVASIDWMVGKAIAAGRPPETAWDAGDSSAGYSGKRFGTFNMICEVPLWRDARERDSHSSGRTLAEVFREQAQMMRDDEALMAPYVGELKSRASGNDQTALLASVEDAVHQSAAGIEEAEGAAADAASQRVLPLRELVQYEYGTAMFRSLAMAQRLARLQGLNELAARAGERISSRLAAFSRVAQLRPVELHATTGLQIAAILAAAQDLQRNG